MYKEIDEIPEVEGIPEIDEIIPEVEEIPEIDEIIPEVEEIPEIDEKPNIDEIIPEVEEKPKIGQGLESEASIDEKPPSIEKPKITARVSNPDSSFSYM